MRKFIYAVQDIKVKAYLSPFFMRTHEEAIRSFADACRNSETQFNTHPEDFNLHVVGEWNEEVGAIEGITPMLLASASEYTQINKS